MLRRTITLQICLVLASLGCGWAQTSKVKPQVKPVQAPTTPQAPAPSQNSDAAFEWLIGPGDLLQISVEGAPDYNKEVRVSPSGNVLLPLVGEVRLGGLSSAGAQKHIAERLVQGGYFNKPQVSVFQKEYASQGISVLGEVQKPGVYPMLSSPTLFGLISAAGGITAKAGNKVIISHRNKALPEEQVHLPHDQQQWSASNVSLRPGDTVLVTKAGIVYVVGDVRQPGGYVMEGARLTVLQAIAMAQGPNPDASLNRAKLIRGTAGGPKAKEIALKDILTAKAPDLELRADDIIFVPTSKAKAGTRKVLSSILEVASGVAIYR
jgi:polysaccharide export outer membrane protein